MNEEDDKAYRSFYVTDPTFKKISETFSDYMYDYREAHAMLRAPVMSKHDENCPACKLVKERHKGILSRYLI
jgi:transposase-like protein